jgi:iron complex outermembrane receptor protein
MTRAHSTLLAGCSVLGLFAGLSGTAIAQTSPASAGPETVQTVVVTARKQSEDILKVPVAVSALTASDLDARDILTTNDLANFVPGLTDDQTLAGSARNDRSFQELIIRGMVPSSIDNPTTSLFLNGTPIGSADFLQNLDDISSIEVLKGPQSAYFGRETFAGAVNVITKPASNTLTANLTAEFATRDTYNVSANVSGPIVPGKLMVSVGGAYDTHDGSYDNAFNPSQTLGDQLTKTLHLAFTAKPIENLTIKVYSEYLQDDDGPAATGILIAGFPYGTISTPAASIAKFTQGNCTIAGTPWFCGTLPGLISSASPAQTTTLTPSLLSVINTPVGNIIPASQSVQGFGLKRDAFHSDANVEYYMPSLGLTATYLTSYNHDAWSILSDLSNEDIGSGGQYPGGVLFSVPLAFFEEQVNHDLSQEVRLTTDQTKPYRAMVGMSYVETGQNTAFAEANPFIPLGYDVSQTTGLFFALAYDVLPKLTINFDGRYQRDVEIAYSGTSKIEGASKNFLPRVSAQYKFTPGAMVYFTYSQGVNPGTFNAGFAELPAASQAELTAKGLSGGGVVTKPEDLTNYELGLKGRFWGGRATLAADIYYDIWTNQLQALNYLFPANDPANPYNIPSYAGYNPNNATPLPYTGTDNAASSIAKGIEIDSTIIPVNHLTVNLAAAYTDTQYTSFTCTDCYPSASVNAKGKYLPDAPLFSFTGGVQYGDTAYMFGKTENWYVRADYIYKDGFYLDAANTAKTPDTELVNIRGGISWNNVTLEGYVNNLFNDKTYTSGIDDNDFGGFFAETAVMVGLDSLITGGVRLKFKY